MSEVTVLMTVYNGRPYLPLAIKSILNQTFSDFEFLIVNDCSTDDTRDVILSYDDPRIRLLDNDENIGQTRSLNRGLACAQGELVARMDADDISHPKRLEMQVAYLHAHPSIVAIGTNLRFIDHTGRVIRQYMRPKHDLALRWMQLFECPISCGAVTFRKSIIWDILGGFDPSISISQDWELWSRVLPEYKIANLPDLLLDVRKHVACVTAVARDAAIEEQRRICRSNPHRILGIAEDSEEWLRKVEMIMPWPNDHPDLRLEVVEVLYDRFCALYPIALEDQDILRELSRQYLRAAEESRFNNLLTAFKAWQLAWPRSSKSFYLWRFTRWLAILVGARQVKSRILKIIGKTT